MPEPINPVLSINDIALETFRQGDRFESADGGISEKLALTQLGACYTEVPPGKSGCPYHVHHVDDEMFVILQGSGEYRFGDRLYPVNAGDILGAPRGGAEYAHQLVNTGKETLKYLAISSQSETEVMEYPDSGKFMVSSRRQSEQSRRFRYVGRVEDEHDYWEGED